ncbi:MAG: hypothetical protein PHF21_05070 [Bacilli bacterium]|nr:hypothetical protein [Bacilli bacterium]
MKEVLKNLKKRIVKKTKKAPNKVSMQTVLDIKQLCEIIDGEMPKGMKNKKVYDYKLYSP